MTGIGHRFGRETIPKFAVGQPAHRTEDARFLTGSGRYTDDINLPGQVHGIVVRSPFAHARIRALSVAAARAASGVVAVVTGADLATRDANAIPSIVALNNRDGTPSAAPPRPVLCTDTVRHVGDGIAFVVAETVDQAKDAAEKVDVDYEPLDAVVETVEANQPGRPRVHDGVAGNLVFDWAFGDADAVERPSMRRPTSPASHWPTTGSSPVPWRRAACGEAGAIAAPPPLINTILDALAELGINHIDMPATPERVWRLIRPDRLDGEG